MLEIWFFFWNKHSVALSSILGSNFYPFLTSNDFIIKCLDHKYFLSGENGDESEKTFLFARKNLSMIKAFDNLDCRMYKMVRHLC